MACFNVCSIEWITSKLATAMIPSMNTFIQTLSARPILHMNKVNNSDFLLSISKNISYVIFYLQALLERNVALMEKLSPKIPLWSTAGCYLIRFFQSSLKSCAILLTGAYIVYIRSKICMKSFLQCQVNNAKLLTIHYLPQDIVNMTLRTLMLSYFQ